MLDPKSINDIVEQVMKKIPEGVKSIPQDLRDNVSAAVRDSFSKLDLVTREEFDTQTKVLARTREKLEALEQQISELEKDA